MNDISSSSIERYLAAPDHCPYCDSSEILGLEFDFGVQSRKVECQSCGNSWHELFQMIGLEGISQ